MNRKRLFSSTARSLKKLADAPNSTDSKLSVFHSDSSEILDVAEEYEADSEEQVEQRKIQRRKSKGNQ